MDFYQEQHSYTLARNAPIDADSDEETSWVMLDRDGEVVKLPGEKIYYKVRSRIALDLSTPKALPNVAPFAVKSDSGTIYITNNRLIYLPARPTDTFKSFSAPILDFEDTRVTSGFFAPWSWNGIVKPTTGGGVPASVPRLEIKLTFKEGGHDAFQTKFEIMKERLSYARTLQQETGQIIPTGEDLPKYEATQSQTGPGLAAASASSAASAAAVASAAAAAAAAARAGTAASAPRSGPGAGEGWRSPPGFEASVAAPSASQPWTDPRASAYSDAGRSVPQATPDEPPPDYEEAQAQAIGNRLEDSVREAAGHR